MEPPESPCVKLLPQTDRHGSDADTIVQVNSQLPRARRQTLRSEVEDVLATAVSEDRPRIGGRRGYRFVDRTRAVRHLIEVDVGDQARVARARPCQCELHRDRAPELEDRAAIRV